VFLVILILFSACPNSQPVIGLPDAPFVVGDIESADITNSDDMCIYYAKNWEGNQSYPTGLTEIFSRSCIVLPAGMYNVNDTIKLEDFKLPKNIRK
jgi:hypothetical protein